MRLLPFLVGLGVIVASGYVHGLWTQRWEKSVELEAVVARLERLPGDLPNWKVYDGDIDDRALARAGAEGAWIKRYRSRDNQHNVLVILLIGRSGQMSVHRPEHCYSGAGYDLAGLPRRTVIPFGPEDTPAEFFTGRFVKPETVGVSQLRIYWSWLAGNVWKAPDSPRWTFAPLPVLSKLYVVRETRVRSEKPDDDPSVAFLKELLPVVTRDLTAP